MASKICVACLQMGNRQVRAITKIQKSVPNASRLSSRAFASTSRSNADELGAKSVSSNPIPPVTPKVGSGGAPASTNVASKLKQLTGSFTETYSAYGSTEILYKECAKQADYSVPQALTGEDIPETEDGEHIGVGEGWWIKELGLIPSFSTWSQVTMLHIYLLSSRIRCFERDTCKIWQQHLIDHFFYDAEHRLERNHNMSARGTRNKVLKDLFLQWRGLIVAYDEGQVKGDAVLAAAIWRNVMKGKEDVDIKKLSMIVSYMRKGFKRMEAVLDQELQQGMLVFDTPADEAKIVRLRSQSIDVPLQNTSTKPATPGKPAPKRSTSN